MREGKEVRLMVSLQEKLERHAEELTVPQTKKERETSGGA